MSTKLIVKKRVKNCTLYENGMIRVDNIRYSYPHVDKPWKKEGDAGDAKFSLTGLMPKESHEEAKTLIAEVMKQLITDAKLTGQIKADKKFLRDGDAGASSEMGDEEVINSYAGHWYISARETNRPTLRNAQGIVLDPKDDIDSINELFYGGAWGHMLIRPWMQDNKHGKRLNAGLVAVVFGKDGEPFGQGRVDDSDAWADIEEGGGSASSAENDDDEL